MKETTGMIIRKKLGLQDFDANNTLICRVLISTSKPIYLIYYDSKRFRQPLNRQVIFGFPEQSGLFIGESENEEYSVTPFLKLQDFNGNLFNSLFFYTDLAFKRVLPKTPFNFSETACLVFNKKKLKLNEVVTFEQLRQKDLISTKTMYFRKERDKLKYRENTASKLIDCSVNQADNSVTFFFLTTATPKYPADYKYKEVDPKTLSLVYNGSKLYELQFKILNFFDGLKTIPEGQPITKKELSDILAVANIKVFSSSPSFQYQGFNYWLSQLDASIYPTDIKPKVWDKVHGDGKAFLDKHLYGLLRQIKFFIPQMAQKLNRKLAERGLISKKD